MLIPKMSQSLIPEANSITSKTLFTDKDKTGDFIIKANKKSYKIHYAVFYTNPVMRAMSQFSSEYKIWEPKEHTDFEIQLFIWMLYNLQIKLPKIGEHDKWFSLIKMIDMYDFKMYMRSIEKIIIEAIEYEIYSNDELDSDEEPELKHKIHNENALKFFLKLKHHTVEKIIVPKMLNIWHSFSLQTYEVIFDNCSLIAFKDIHDLALCVMSAITNAKITDSDRVGQIYTKLYKYMQPKPINLEPQEKKTREE